MHNLTLSNNMKIFEKNNEIDSHKVRIQFELGLKSFVGRNVNRKAHYCYGLIKMRLRSSVFV